eukprot:31180-Pelagococcus_subviridis.AAC.11
MLRVRRQRRRRRLHAVVQDRRVVSHVRRRRRVADVPQPPRRRRPHGDERAHRVAVRDGVRPGNAEDAAAAAALVAERRQSHAHERVPALGARIHAREERRRRFVVSALDDARVLRPSEVVETERVVRGRLEQHARVVEDDLELERDASSARARLSRSAGEYRVGVERVRERRLHARGGETAAVHERPVHDERSNAERVVDGRQRYRLALLLRASTRARVGVGVARERRRARGGDEDDVPARRGTRDAVSHRAALGETSVARGGK